MSNVLVPVTVPLSTTEARRIAAGYIKPPFRIINPGNSDSVGVVWLARNPGLRVDEGTPLSAGTSITWNNEGDVWAICDTDGVSVIVTTEVDDWQPDPVAIAAAILNSGVLVIDRPVTLLSGTLTIGAGATDFLDISRYQSIYVVITDISGAANSAIVEFDIFENPTTTILHQMQVDFNPSVGWSCVLPCIGNRFRILTNIGDFQVLVIASNRPVNSMKQEINNPANVLESNWIYALFNQTLATATDLTLDLPPWFGTVEVRCDFICTAAMGASHIREMVRDSGGLSRRLQRVAFTATPVATAFNGYMQFAMSGAATRVVINNQSGVNFTSLNVAVTPVSGFGSVA